MDLTTSTGVYWSVSNEMLVDWSFWTVVWHMFSAGFSLSMENKMPWRRGETRTKYFVMFEAICSIDEISKGTPLLAVLLPRFNLRIGWALTAHGNQDSQDSADVFSQHSEDFWIIHEKTSPKLLNHQHAVTGLLAILFATQRLQILGIKNNRLFGEIPGVLLLGDLSTSRSWGWDWAFELSGCQSFSKTGLFSSGN